MTWSAALGGSPPRAPYSSSPAGWSTVLGHACCRIPPDLRGLAVAGFGLHDWVGVSVHKLIAFARPRPGVL
eukprot:3689722-Pyramimonas_sp.AAC.1